MDGQPDGRRVLGGELDAVSLVGGNQHVVSGLETEATSVLIVEDGFALEE